MVWVIAFGELFFGDLWCVVWGYGGMRTHFSLLNPQSGCTVFLPCSGRLFPQVMWHSRDFDAMASKKEHGGTYLRQDLTSLATS